MIRTPSMAGMAMTPFRVIPALTFREVKRLTPLTVEPAMTQSLPTGKMTHLSAELETTPFREIGVLTRSGEMTKIKITVF